MAGEVAISMSQLQELVGDVRKTKRARVVHLADGVVAVIKPEKSPVTRRAERRAPKSAGSRQTVYSLESAFGSVPIPPHLKGKDIEAIIQDAKDDYAERLARD